MAQNLLSNNSLVRSKRLSFLLTLVVEIHLFECKCNKEFKIENKILIYVL